MRYPIKSRAWRPKPVLPRKRPEIDWREEVERMLIEGGTDAVLQSVITLSLRATIGADEINAYLDVLARQHKAQKFYVKQSRSGRPATIWRATTLILED